jgi:hypothetical protein
MNIYGNTFSTYPATHIVRRLIQNPSSLALYANVSHGHLSRGLRRLSIEKSCLTIRSSFVEQNTCHKVVSIISISYILDGEENEKESHKSEHFFSLYEYSQSAKRRAHSVHGLKLKARYFSNWRLEERKGLALQRMVCAWAFYLFLSRPRSLIL